MTATRIKEWSETLRTSDIASDREIWQATRRYPNADELAAAAAIMVHHGIHMEVSINSSTILVGVHYFKTSDLVKVAREAGLWIDTDRCKRPCSTFPRVDAK